MSITATAAAIRELPSVIAENHSERIWMNRDATSSIDATKLPRRSFDEENVVGKDLPNLNHNRVLKSPYSRRGKLAPKCSYCHVPYHHRIAPFNNMKLVPCLLCGKKWVPEVLLTTSEPPSRLPIRGPGVLVQARVCRHRTKSYNRESDALAVSEALPFLEYELARQLMLKLKVIGRNAAFGLRSEVRFCFSSRKD